MATEIFTVGALHLAPRTIGVYAIRNTLNGKAYIGSAAGRAGFRARWQEHRRDLDAGESCSLALQRAWVKYGREAFTFDVLEVLERSSAAQQTRAAVLAAEQRYIDASGAVASGYNILPTAGSRLGAKLSPEQRERLRQRVAADPAWQQRLKSSLGCKRSDETRAKQSAAAVARWADPERAERMREALRASIKARGGHSEETRAAISKARKGYKVAEDVRQKMVSSQKARWTDELRAEQSQKQLASWANPERRQQQAVAQTGRKHSPETLAKMRAAQQRRYSDPVEAERMREVQQRGAAAKRANLKNGDGA